MSHSATTFKGIQVIVVDEDNHFADPWYRACRRVGAQDSPLARAAEDGANRTHCSVGRCREPIVAPQPNPEKYCQHKTC